MKTTFTNLLTGCGRYESQLAAYSEGSLSPGERERVAAHLRRCASCREEVAAYAEVADLLRSHPPTAAAPAPDLWARIEAQITPPPPEPFEPSPRVWLRSWQPAAAGMLAAGIVIAGVLDLPRVQPVHAPPSQTVALSPVPTPTRIALAAPEPKTVARAATPIDAVRAVASASLDANEQPLGKVGAAESEGRFASRRATIAVKKSSVVAAFKPRKKHHAALSPVRVATNEAPAGRRLLSKAAEPETIVSVASARTMGAGNPGAAEHSPAPSPTPEARLFASTAAPAVDTSNSSGSVAESAASPSVASVSPPRKPVEVAMVSRPHAGFTRRNDAAATRAAAAVSEDTLTREVPAAVSTVDMTAPLRRQTGLFSYQAR